MAALKAYAEANPGGRQILGEPVIFQRGRASLLGR